MQTAYTVKSKNLTSSAATVGVKPRLRLAKVARHRYSLSVFAAQSFAGKSATFERYRPALKRWRAVQRVLLHANSSGVAPTVITSATYVPTVPPYRSGWASAYWVARPPIEWATTMTLLPEACTRLGAAATPVGRGRGTSWGASDSPGP